MIWIEPAKRERTKPGNYSIDQYYRDNMKTGGPAKSDKPKVIRAPKQISINDFQFYPPRLVELQQKEYDAHLVSTLLPRIKGLRTESMLTSSDHSTMSFPFER